MDMNFLSDRAEINAEDNGNPGPEDEEAITIETLKIKVQALGERTEKSGEIITTLFQGIGFLGNRMTEAENLIQQQDRKHFGAITSLRGDLNRTDGHILALQAERDRINNALIQAFNSILRGFYVIW